MINNNFESFSSRYIYIEFEKEKADIFLDVEHELSEEKEKLIQDFDREAFQLLKKKQDLNARLIRRFIPDLFFLAISAVVTWYQRTSIQASLQIFSERTIRSISFFKGLVLAVAFIGLMVLRKSQRTAFVKSVEQQIESLNLDILKVDQVEKSGKRYYRFTKTDLIYGRKFLHLVVDKYWEMIKVYIENSDEEKTIGDKYYAVLNKTSDNLLKETAPEKRELIRDANQKIQSLWKKFFDIDIEFAGIEKTFNRLVNEGAPPITIIHTNVIESLKFPPMITTGHTFKFKL